MTLEFLEEAARDAEEATRFYEDRVLGLGVRFRVELERTCSRILEGPERWRLRKCGYRRINFTGFPYYLAYIVRGDRIVVVAVGHGSRRPEYWLGEEEE